MDNITILDLLYLVKYYSEEDIEKIKKAYRVAEEAHRGKPRASGEPYIIHPLNVACTLAEQNSDVDTICAGLLHDTIEDTKITKEWLAEEFNETIAELVDGVTKIGKMNFSSREEMVAYNTRKLIIGMTTDVRIIMIKLADRLHNMRTLQFKSNFKQQENALETINIFAPLAEYIGAYRIKCELEDLSLMYLKKDKYLEINEEIEQLKSQNWSILEEMNTKISQILNSKNIPNEIKIRMKNIYGIYKRKDKGQKIDEMHDLFSLKIMVDDIMDCYTSLGFIHQQYRYREGTFKDYIGNPKPNMYRSLHTTVIGKNGLLVQNQIRTFKMDKVASFGLMTEWQFNPENAREKMQKELREKFQFVESLEEIDKVFIKDREFVKQVKNELFGEKVYVQTRNGTFAELPKGSTAMDFAYQVGNEVGNNLERVIVNKKEVLPNYVLQNNDMVIVITKEKPSVPKPEWAEGCKTTRALARLRTPNK